MLRGSTLADEITGGTIVYENLTDLFTVDGATNKGPTGALGSAGRVRVMLTPKAEPTAGAPAAADAARLKPSPALGGVPQ